MAVKERTPTELAELITKVATLTPGGTYRCKVTGLEGTLRVPADISKVPYSPKDGRDRVYLDVPSQKEDRDTERRLVFIDDLEEVT